MKIFKWDYRNDPAFYLLAAASYTVLSTVAMYCATYFAPLIGAAFLYEIESGKSKKRI